MMMTQSADLENRWATYVIDSRSILIVWFQLLCL